jgi:hypothetical protein
MSLSEFEVALPEELPELPCATLEKLAAPKGESPCFCSSGMMEHAFASCVDTAVSCTRWVIWTYERGAREWAMGSSIPVIPSAFCSETLVLPVVLIAASKMGGARVSASGEHAHKGFRKYGVYKVVRFVDLEEKVYLVEDII